MKTWIAVLSLAVTLQSKDYYSTTFVKPDSASADQFCRTAAPSDCVIYPHFSPHEFSVLSDTTQRAILAFYNHHPGKGVQTGMIGIVFAEDSLNTFRPVCVDSFPVIPNKYGNTRMELMMAMINKSTGELTIQIQYGRAVAHDNSSCTYKTYFYEWPDNFSSVTRLKLLRTE